METSGVSFQNLQIRQKEINDKEILAVIGSNKRIGKLKTFVRRYQV